MSWVRKWTREGKKIVKGNNNEGNNNTLDENWREREKESREKKSWKWRQVEFFRQQLVFDGQRWRADRDDDDYYHQTYFFDEDEKIEDEGEVEEKMFASPGKVVRGRGREQQWSGGVKWEKEWWGEGMNCGWWWEGSLSLSPSSI